MRAPSRARSRASASDDLLDLASTQATGASWADGVLTIDTSLGAIRLNVAGNYASNSFTVRSDGLGGTYVAGGFGDVHMMCFDGLAYDFQAVGDFVAVQSNDAGNPWQVQIRTASAPGATSITTGLAASDRRCAHKLRRRPGQARPCRRYRGCGAPCRRRAELRRRHAGAAFRQRLSAQLEHGPVGHGHRPRRLSRLGGRPRLAGRPRLGARACSAATAAGQRISSCRTALSCTTPTTPRFSASSPMPGASSRTARCWTTRRRPTRRCSSRRWRQTSCRTAPPRTIPARRIRTRTPRPICWRLLRCTPDRSSLESRAPAHDQPFSSSRRSSSSSRAVSPHFGPEHRTVPRRLKPKCPNADKNRSDIRPISVLARNRSSCQGA